MDRSPYLPPKSEITEKISVVDERKLNLTREIRIVLYSSLAISPLFGFIFVMLIAPNFFGSYSELANLVGIVIGFPIYFLVDKNDHLMVGAIVTFGWVTICVTMFRLFLFIRH